MLPTFVHWWQFEISIKVKYWNKCATSKARLLQPVPESSSSASNSSKSTSMAFKVKWNLYNQFFWLVRDPSHTVLLQAVSGFTSVPSSCDPPLDRVWFLFLCTTYIVRRHVADTRRYKAMAHLVSSPKNFLPIAKLNFEGKLLSRYSNSPKTIQNTNNFFSRSLSYFHVLRMYSNSYISNLQQHNFTVEIVLKVP